MANDFVRFARSVEYSTGKKRGRRPVFNANRFYPHALERELASIAKSELERFLSECTEAALAGIPVRDDMEELSKVPETLPESFAAEVGGVAEKMRRKASTDFAEWSEMVVGKPYYPPEAEREIFDTWTANFQTLCKSAEADAKKDISLLVSSAKNEGWNRGRLEKSIRERLPSKYRARAENIARTELGKLNSAAKLSQFREVGISYYKWLTTIDGRERDSHRSMNGLICSVSNPGVYYTENPDDPLHPVEHARTAGMFHGNPGEDFQCRCSMVAWDPEIDGMYEVRESPEGPDGKEEPGTSPESAESARLGAELEKARREREETETALKNAENAKREAERRAEILRKANERHAGRKVSVIEKIREKWRKRNVSRKLRKLGHTPDYVNNIFEIEKNIGVKYSGEMDHSKADTGKVNPKYNSEDTCKINCQSCCIAYELRRRGFNVEARPKTSLLQRRIAEDDNLAWIDPITKQKPKYAYGGSFPNEKGRFDLQTHIDDIERFTSEDGRYFIGWYWKTSIGGGHIITAERKGGTLLFYDSQNDTILNLEQFKKMYLADFGRSWSVSVIRVDDKLLNEGLNFKDVVELP